ncbi:MAG TPA: type IX secretion system plug protein domain-containing protein [Bacteroidales bacterium]|jgi:hypothetical protein|nr:type IX secretion system plug protein domain-containing protein [Bacteroidales bacterium]
MISPTVSGVSFIFIVIGITTANVFGLERNDLPDTLDNRIYDKDIHSVWLGNQEWEFSAPVIESGTDQKLELRFDDLSGDTRSFGYTMIHCNMNWQRSQLSESEYLSGFGRGWVKDSKQSFNTTYFYINYQLVFPEEDCIPVLSGNYVLVVYDEADPENIILTRRFYVAEKTMDVKATLRQPAHGSNSATGQQLHFSMNFNNADIRDPKSEITVIAIQNSRFDKQKTFENPYLIKPGEMEFTDPDGGIFEAGNEFRTLDIKSMRYQTENIADIEFRNPYYHVLMKADKIRSNKPWFSKSDLNGNYYIDKEKSDDRHTEADYVYVHFNLELPSVYSANKVYIAGAFNDWKKDAGSLMQFNPDNGYFEITLLMKQGLYDYCFLMENIEDRVIDEYEIEGSYYETENDYSIFIYFHDQFKRYDHLAGYLPIK